MCFQRWLKQTKHEKSFKSPVATLLPPFSRLLPHHHPVSPPTPSAPIIFTTHFFLSVPPSFAWAYAQPTIAFKTTGAPLFPHLGGPDPPPHTHAYTPSTSQPKDAFPVLNQRLKTVHHVLLYAVVYCDNDDVRQEADYGGWRAKYVTEVSVKNVVSLWGRAANFSANPISTGGLPGIWLPKPTWDRSYLFLL